MQVYLDNASTTPLDAQVMEAMSQGMAHFANPSSLHHLGAEVEEQLNRARVEVARSLNVRAGHVVFTSGGTEANNLAIKGVASKHQRPGRLITSAIEHPSVREVFYQLATQGWEVVTIDVDAHGQISMQQLAQALDQPVSLVSIMAVNNEVGAIQPLDKVASLVKERQPRAIVHVDAVQALGKLDLSVHNIDLVTVSAHKVHGPKGVGALYAADRGLLNPQMNGGGQEGGLRSGTENVLGILGFGQAVRIARENLAVNGEHVTQLRQRFCAGLEKLDCSVVSGRGVPHILAVTFAGFAGEVLLQALSGKGVYVSTGAACSGKRGNLSHVAQAMGLDQEARKGMLRFSFSSYNTNKEIDFALARLTEVLDELAFVRGRRSR